VAVVTDTPPTKVVVDVRSARRRLRVSALAGPGEVLVSSTVKDLVAGSGIKDLVAGSGITFRDRGRHVLKGVPDEWRVFAVEN
jgi:class 3 adenylate cyclase